MDYKTMVSIAKQHEDPYKSKLYEITLSGGDAAPHPDNGMMRWLDEGQIIRFDNPDFHKANAEFFVNGKKWQRIWFSQLRSYGVYDDLQTPLLDEIIFKGQPARRIREKYNSAQTFWETVKDKRFKVEIIGSGYTLNLKNDLVNSIINNAIATRKALPGKADTVVLDHIRQAVLSGSTDSVKGTLKNKKAYRLIEI